MHSLVVFSPMPPLRNGIADYARTLLDYHCRCFDCIVVIDNAAPYPVGLPEGVLVMRDVEYRQHASNLARQRHLFHVGNNGDHTYMLDHLDRVRGTVVLHDPSLHHMLKEGVAGGKNRHASLQQAAWRSHGRAGIVLADQTARFGWESMINYLELNGVAEVLPAAAGAIVHSWYGLLRVEQARPGLPCRRIEHFADQPKGERETRRAAARRALSLPDDEIVLASLGFVINAKQIPQVLAALATIEASLPRLRYLVVGQECDLSVMDAARRAGVAHLVQHIDYVPESMIATYLDAADILVNLRYPTMGESSGSLCRAIARGVCAMVSDHGSYAELPDEVVVKIPPSPEVAGELAPLLLAHVTLPGLRRAVEAAAYRWARDNLAIADIADAYHEAIEAFHTQSKPFTIRPAVDCCEADPTAAMIRERIALVPTTGFVGRLWWTEGLVPLPGADGDLLVGGITGLGSLAASILRVSTTTVGPGDVGLYVGAWSAICQSGTALADFVARLELGAAAFFDVWQDGGGGVSLTVEALGDVLGMHEMEVVAVAEGTAKPLHALGLRQETHVEVGVLARRRASSIASRAA